jgi:uncharacterized protein (TIGR03067 family)
MIWLFLAVTLLPPPSGVGVADDQTLIEGQWQMESLQEGGAAVDLAIAPSTWTIINGVMTIHPNDVAGGMSDLRITLNPRTSPKQFDMVYIGEDPNLEITIRGIYQLYGLRFTRCYVYGDRPRPTAFVSPPGSTVKLHTLKRPEKPSLPQ